MAHPALENMSYEELTALIDEASKLRTEKFDGRQPDEKPQTRANEIVDESKADPFRSPTA